jgi:hypothetical protein
MAKSGNDTGGDAETRALEVTAIFGDAIIALQHLVDLGDRRKRPRVTSSLFLGAALLLALSGLAFAKGVHLAAKNESQLRAHLAAEKMAHEFRPEALHAGWEWLGLGGAAAGLLLLSLAMARKHEGSQSDAFSVGSAAAADYPLPLQTGGRFDLLRVSESREFRLQIPEHWSADFAAEGGGGERQTSAKGFVSWALAEECEVLVRCGDHRFRIRSVTPPRKQSLPLLASLDSRFLAVLGGTSVVVLSMIYLLDTHFDEQKTLYADAFSLSPRISDYRVPAKERPIPTPHFALGIVDGPLGGTGSAMVGPSSAMGSKQSKLAAGRYSIARKQAEPQLARGHAMAEARQAGILGLLRQNAFMAAPSAHELLTSGQDAADVYGGLMGNQVGEMSGAWGYGFTGLGDGGGGSGSGWGTIGSGNYGTLGHGSGTGDGWGAGEGLGVHGHDASAPNVRVGNAEAIGDLDKNIIRRYIRRKLPRIEHCYERALLTKTDLEGSVETTFQISPAGEVQSVSASGIDDEEMHRCIASAIESIQFPKPRGGGYVAVRYPFTFVPGS